MNRTWTAAGPAHICDDAELTDLGWGTVTITNLHERAKLLGVPTISLLPY